MNVESDDMNLVLLHSPLLPPTFSCSWLLNVEVDDETAGINTSVNVCWTASRRLRCWQSSTFKVISWKKKEKGFLFVDYFVGPF